MAQIIRLGALAGMMAAASMALTPAYAAEMLPAPGADKDARAFGAVFAADADVFGPAAEQAQADESDYHRRYRRYRRNRIDGGDVLAGVLILGGIAAVASAASRNNDRRYDNRRYDNRRYDDRRYDDRRYDDRRYDDRRYDDRRYDDRRRSDGSGLDSAVSQCMAEIERDTRVANVDGASRVASGWIVSGTLDNGTGFSCQIDNNGRISNIDYGGMSGVSYDGADFGRDDYAAREAQGQWSAASYAEARAATGIQGPDRADSQVAYSGIDGAGEPAYPGGPLPGEEE